MDIHMYEGLLTLRQRLISRIEDNNEIIRQAQARRAKWESELAPINAKLLDHKRLTLTPSYVIVAAQLNNHTTTEEV